MRSTLGIMPQRIGTANRLGVAAANWATVRLEFMAHPTVYLAMILVIVLKVRVIWFEGFERDGDFSSAEDLGRVFVRSSVVS